MFWFAKHFRLQTRFFFFIHLLHIMIIFSSSWNNACRLVDHIVLVVWHFCCSYKCGQTYTGFCSNKVLAPNGILGLGMGEISMPNTLNKKFTFYHLHWICEHYESSFNCCYCNCPTNLGSIMTLMETNLSFFFLQLQAMILQPTTIASTSFKKSIWINL